MITACIVAAAAQQSYPVQNNEIQRYAYPVQSAQNPREKRFRKCEVQHFYNEKRFLQFFIGQSQKKISNSISRCGDNKFENIIIHTRRQQ